MYYSPVRHSSIAARVRLACIRHAASVHPEPGSNSLIKCLFQVMINSHLSKPFTVLVRWTVFKNECKRIFSSCVSLFSYQGPCLATAILDYHIFSGLSRTFFIFLKISFFKFFQFFSTALIDYHKFHSLSRTFLIFSLKLSAEKEGFEPSHGVNRLHP